MTEPIKMLRCDTCGQKYSEWEFVETIEEFLCENCASGYDPDEPDDNGCLNYNWSDCDDNDP